MFFGRGDVVDIFFRFNLIYGCSVIEKKGLSDVIVVLLNLIDWWNGVFVGLDLVMKRLKCVNWKREIVLNESW